MRLSTHSCFPKARFVQVYIILATDPIRLADIKELIFSASQKFSIEVHQICLFDINWQGIISSAKIMHFFRNLNT